LISMSAAAGTAAAADEQPPATGPGATSEVRAGRHGVHAQTGQRQVATGL
jgi:hypothetical protein